ncbi:MAG: tRNA epoxyqueuosine(34) reductase QueG [Thermoguttaceae bacterium]|nr:tRNA epoxyqueuosine(34) reductase QueG [Thermoguttaceae bacterium]
MRYLAARADAYQHPRHVLEGVRSVFVLGKVYRTAEPNERRIGEGRVSRYAWGADYHDLIRDRLRDLAALHQRLAPGAAVRGVVDTAPLLEREFAQLAGLGWIGKNTLLLNPRHGSWLFLAALLTSEVLEYDRPFGSDHCGTCRACLDACPTGALFEPYRLDARRCISYLTIEFRSHVPRRLRPEVGAWVFGCDLCQEVCPWNRRSPATEEGAFQPGEGMNPLDLAGLFALDDDAFRRRFRHTPLWRAKRRGLLRNAAIALGNQPHDAAIPGLVQGLADPEPLVRGACAWALGRHASPDAERALRDRIPAETHVEVLAEIESALIDPAKPPSIGN